MAVVFMHGLGDTPAGWSSLESELPATLRRAGHEPAEPLAFKFPAAPKAPVSISGGAVQTSWFDLFDWPIGPDAKDDQKGLLASVKRVHAVIDEIVAAGKVPSDKIVVGGFSQGGAVALLATYLYPKKLGACICLSGWLTLHEKFKKDVGAEGAKNAKTPCFWGHGMMDPVVLPEQPKVGSKVMTDLGIPVEVKMYPIQHSAHPLEMKDMAKFIADSLEL